MDLQTLRAYGRKSAISAGIGLLTAIIYKQKQNLQSQSNQLSKQSNTIETLSKENKHLQQTVQNLTNEINTQATINKNPKKKTYTLEEIIQSDDGVIQFPARDNYIRIIHAISTFPTAILLEPNNPTSDKNSLCTTTTENGEYRNCARIVNNDGLFKVNLENILDDTVEYEFELEGETDTAITDLDSTTLSEDILQTEITFIWADYPQPSKF